MQIKQIGNGGGLDFSQTNSSFLIRLSKENYLLFDCGFNIMEKLLEIDKSDDEFKLKNLSMVYISHMHEDHVGNLASLIYYRYFMLGELQTTVLASKKIATPLNSILKLCKSKLKSGSVVPATMYKSIYIEDTAAVIDEHTRMYISPTLHGKVACFGVYLQNETGLDLFISGDTKAADIVETFVRLVSGDDLTSVLVYHDFSHWDAVSKNVHACNNDIRSEYTEEFQNVLTYYHNGDIFDPNWITL